MDAGGLIALAKVLKLLALSGAVWEMLRADVKYKIEQQIIRTLTVPFVVRTCAIASAAYGLLWVMPYILTFAMVLGAMYLVFMISEGWDYGTRLPRPSVRERKIWMAAIAVPILLAPVPWAIGWPRQWTVVPLSLAVFAAMFFVNRLTDAEPEKPLKPPSRRETTIWIGSIVVLMLFVLLSWVAGWPWWFGLVALAVAAFVAMLLGMPWLGVWIAAKRPAWLTPTPTPPVLRRTHYVLLGLGIMLGLGGLLTFVIPSGMELYLFRPYEWLARITQARDEGSWSVPRKLADVAVPDFTAARLIETYHGVSSRLVAWMPRDYSYFRLLRYLLVDSARGQVAILLLAAELLLIVFMIRCFVSVAAVMAWLFFVWSRFLSRQLPLREVGLLPVGALSLALIGELLELVLETLK